MDTCGNSDDAQPSHIVPARKRSVGATQIYGTTLFAVLLSYYGGLYLLWSIDSKLYRLWMKFIGVAAWDFPFLDIISVLAWADCHHAGFDVFRTNPCDPLNRLFAYSPVLLDLPVHWLGVRNATAVGLTIDLAFLAMLPLLLRPDSLRALAIAILACLSPAVVFAVERANLDVFIIALIAAAALSARGQSQNLISYAVYLAVGLLKFYPLGLLGLMVRERPRVALACGSLAAAILVALIAYYWSMLTKAMALIPPTGYFGDMFGAVVLPYGLARFFRLPHIVGSVLFAVLLAVMAIVAIRLARRLKSEVSAADWDRTNFRLLALGSFLTVGCFLAGMNVGYRVTILLFIVPGLLELQCRARDPGTRLIVGYTLGATLCCFWRQFFENGLTNLGLLRSDSWFGLFFLLLREAVWWGLVFVLSAFIVLYVLHSPLWHALTTGRAAWRLRARNR